MTFNTVANLMDLSGRLAVITGSSGYLGTTFCKALAELGCNLALLDRDSEALEILSRKIRSYYQVEVECFYCDLEDEGDRNDLISTLNQRYEQINILVNNAAFVASNHIEGWTEQFSNQSLASWRRAMEVNLTAPFHLCQALQNKMSQSKGASIINIGSIYGVNAPNWSLYDDLDMSNPAAYAVSKGGLLQFTRWLSTTCAPSIRVNMISPGGIYRSQNEVFVSRYENGTPLARMAGEGDFIGALVYLASDMSNYVTGQNLVVDGGWTVW